MPDSTEAARDADPLRAHGGFADLVGYKLEVWDKDFAEIILTVDKRHLNRSGVMHGGVLSTLIDTACSYAGCYTQEGAEPRRSFSLSLTCNFIGTATEGQRLVARARRSGGGRTLFFASCDVLDESGRIVGNGQGTFKYITLRD